MSNYRFNKEKHLHQLEANGEWKNLTGCTTILGILAKPALIPWASKMCAESIDQKVKGIMIEDEKITPAKAWKKLEENWEAWIEEARKAHAQRKKDAGDYGTKTHDTISVMIKEAIEKNDGYLADINQVNDEVSIKNFIEWAVKNKVKFLETEKNIYSEFLFIGGIVDFVCEIDGQIWIGDVKTAKSGIYAENFWQIAGYHLMLEEMGLYKDITGYLVINLKESGEILEKRSISNEENRQIFRNCLEIYRVQEKLKNNIKD